MFFLLNHKKVYLVLTLWLISSLVYSQNIINEYSNFECSQATRLNLPFSENAKALSNNLPATTNKIVFYEHRDQFSYWYRLIASEDRIIECRISPINANDNYAVYIYKYKEDDFCNKVFYGKIKPLKSSGLTNGKNADNASVALSDLQLKVKKNEAYYFCVLTVSPTNCGHFLKLIDGKDSLIVKAVHYPCSDDEVDLKPLPKKVAPKKVITALPVAEIIKVDTITVRTLVESTKRMSIEAELKIKEELTGKEINIIPVGRYNYKIAIEKGKNYNVECLATGYKNFDHSVIISEYVSADSNVFDIYLKPLKAGDNFVMNNIYFYPNTYALKEGSKKELTYLVNYLTNNPEVRIELQGHTNGDNRCKKNKAYKKKGPEWNYSGSAKKLSLYRAEAIKKYLVQKGVAKQNINTKGFGGERMIIANPKTMEAIDKNVRVEVMILKDSGL